MDARKQFAADSDYYRKNRAGSHNSCGAFIDINDNYRLVGEWVCHGWLKRYEMERHDWLHGKKAKYVLSSQEKAEAYAREFNFGPEWHIEKLSLDRVPEVKDNTWTSYRLYETVSRGKK